MNKFLKYKNLGTGDCEVEGSHVLGRIEIEKGFKRVYKIQVSGIYEEDGELATFEETVGGSL